MSSPKILVVDDSSTIRFQLRRLLAEAGYQVAVAPNGGEGIRLAQQYQPDLVVLDIQMPDPDGYAVCEALKRLGPPCDGLPIVFLTSLQSQALTLLGSEMGAYVRKPVDAERFLKTIDSFLLRRRQDAAGI